MMYFIIHKINTHIQPYNWSPFYRSLKNSFLIIGLNFLLNFGLLFLLLLIANSTSDFWFPFLDFLPLRVGALGEGLLSSNFLSRGQSAVSSSTFLSLVNSLPRGGFLNRLMSGLASFDLSLLLTASCGTSEGISGLFSAWFLKRKIVIGTKISFLSNCTWHRQSDHSILASAQSPCPRQFRRRLMKMSRYFRFPCSPFDALLLNCSSFPNWN